MKSKSDDSKSRDWESLGKYVSQIKSEGLSYKEGAKRFGLEVSDIYKYNERLRNNKSERGIAKSKESDELGSYVLRIEELGLSYVEGAEHFDLNLNSIYKYNAKKKKRIKEKSNGPSGLNSSSGDSSDLSVDGKDVLVSDLESVEEDAVESVDSTSAEPVANIANVDCGLPPGVEELIVNYRLENPDYGYKRIEEYLRSRYFLVMPRKKIREVLKSHGLTGTVDSSFDKSDGSKDAKGSRRFEASYPRELYQMDITYVYLSDKAIYYLVIILDDYSRFCVCSELIHNQLGISMIEVLHRAIERYGKPTKLLTDQGTSFYSWSREQTVFSRYLDDMKIEHIVADPHSPQTLGKVERLNQTVQQELLKKVHFSSYEEARVGISEYFHHYNYARPHQGITGAFPSSRFQGIIGETSRIESELRSHTLDFSRGYLVFKMFEHTISIICSGGGLQIFLDGDLLKRGAQADRSGGAGAVNGK